MHGMHPAFISTRAAAAQGGARAAAVVHGAVVGRRCVGCREGAMHMMHPAFISTRAAATQGGARAAAVVHGAVVGRRCVGCREGRLRPAPWRSVPASSPPSSLCVMHALSSVLSRTFSWPDICHGFLRKAGKLRGNLHSLGSVSRQSCCSSSSRSPARGRGDPGHGPSPFRHVELPQTTRPSAQLHSIVRREQDVFFSASLLPSRHRPQIRWPNLLMCWAAAAGWKGSCAMTCVCFSQSKILLKLQFHLLV